MNHDKSWHLENPAPDSESKFLVFILAVAMLGVIVAAGKLFWG